MADRDPHIKLTAFKNIVISNLGIDMKSIMTNSCTDLEYPRYLEVRKAIANAAKKSYGSVQTVTSIKERLYFSKMTGEEITIFCTASKFTATAFKLYLNIMDSSQLFELCPKIEDSIQNLIAGSLGI